MSLLCTGHISAASDAYGEARTQYGIVFFLTIIAFGLFMALVTKATKDKQELLHEIELARHLRTQVTTICLILQLYETHTALSP